MQNLFMGLNRILIRLIIWNLFYEFQDTNSPFQSKANNEKLVEYK